jgi:O-antigen/teichoic acid export membrane protein
MEQLLRLFAGLAVGVYVARYLGPAQFGLLSYVLVFVPLFGAIAKVGLDGVVIRELVTSATRQRDILGTAFRLKLFGAIAAIALLGASLPLTSNDFTVNAYILIVASGLLFQSFEVVDFHFQSISQAKYASICKLVQLVASSIAKLWLVYEEASLGAFVLLALLDQVSLAVAYVFVAWRKGFLTSLGAWSTPLARSLVAESWPMVASGMAIMFYMRIDQIMIRELLGPESLGHYVAATRIAEVWYFIPAVLCAAMFPGVVRAKSDGVAAYEGRLVEIYRGLLLLGLLCAGGISLLAPFVVGLLYGEQYLMATPILQVQAWCGVFVAIGIANEKWFITESRLGRYTRNTLIGAIVNLLLNWLLIPRFGAVGAAVATLIAYACAAYLMLAVDSVTRRSFVLISKSLFIKRAR